MVDHKVFKVAQIRDLLNQVNDETITFSRFVEILNEQANKVFVKAELILTLESKNDWINKVPRRLPDKNRHKENFLWIDKNGCVFELGEDFAAAERMGTFPCKVYRTITVSQFENRKEGNNV
ncbi:hypothetical protein BWD42_04145 [Sphingobacterium sp. CZ-UAM]|uniref:hypothetical protein n=1 Tax=Sphingobacterium sp. CZ-UAM TaxID=1933868 RepID=UPI000986ACB6|nr:hypothetical protein [Sphingobacterium sp. CZ-UAM]OOG19148.1 hypothetical protein BWD42_04145 [Sphingobacterium sp. CZ-UAM]